MDSNVIGLSNAQQPAAVIASGNGLPVSAHIKPEKPESEEKTPLVSVKNIQEETEKNEFDVVSIEPRLEVLNQQLQERQRDLSFEIDKSSQQPVLKVIHAQTGEVIRQIPNELALKIATSFEQGISELVDTLA